LLKGSVGDENRRFTDERIKYITQKFSVEEMADWYHSLDCYVSTASAEGWGLMQHEAMACGTAVIAPIYAGLAEFMNQDNSYPLKYKEVLADVAPWNITAGGLWSKYDEEHLIESMRHCYYNRKEVHEKGKLAAEQVKKFTIQNTIDQIKKVMEV
jgi:glycosyltransferase involved in cell wall biosynthesis